MRPTTMGTMRAGMCTTVLALGLSCCGTGTGTGTGTESSDPATTSAPDLRLFGDCKADDPALDSGDVIAEADVDGTGAMVEVAYVTQGAAGPCANALFTTLGGERTGLSLGDGTLDQQSVEVVQLDGTARQLLVVHENSHPRGGYLMHLYGAADGQLGEVLADGQPVVGFVATDGGMPPTTAQCAGDGGLTTVTAIAHEPPGVVLAWDVTRTTYSLSGNNADQTSSQQIREAAADPLLRKEMPQLFDPEGYFADCITQ